MITRNVNTVIVNPQRKLKNRYVTKVDGIAVLHLAEIAQSYLEPSMQTEIASVLTMAPTLAEIYFLVF